MKKKTAWWFAIIVWCAMIFYQSSKPAVASDTESMFIVKICNSWLSAIAGPHHFEVTDALVRKSAHFTEYFILGCLLFNGFLTRAKLKKAFWLALVVGVAYAASDEIHQHFVPGRTMRAFDVLIDSSGMALGLALLYLAAKRKRGPGFSG